MSTSQACARATDNEAAKPNPLGLLSTSTTGFPSGPLKGTLFPQFFGFVREPENRKGKKGTNTGEPRQNWV